MGIECRQIIIKPGDIIKYHDAFSIYKIRYGTIASINPIENNPETARIYVMGDRSLSIIDSICLVYSYNSESTRNNDPILRQMPTTNKLYDISFYSHQFGRVDITDLHITHPAHQGFDNMKTLFAKFESEKQNAVQHFLSPEKGNIKTKSGPGAMVDNHYSTDSTQSKPISKIESFKTDRTNDGKDPILNPSLWVTSREEAANGNKE